MPATWRQLVGEQPDVENSEEHGHVAPARQPCAGANRATRRRPERCPICDKKVNFTSRRLGANHPGTDEPIVEYVIDAHTATPRATVERRPRVREAEDA